MFLKKIFSEPFQTSISEGSGDDGLAGITSFSFKLNI